MIAAAGRAAGAGLGVPASLGLLLPMEAGVPIPVPADLVMLLVGERVADGHFPLWAAIVALEVVAVAGTAALFLLARGPGYALVTRLGRRVGLTPERMEHASAAVERRGRVALAVGRATPGLRTVTTISAGACGLSARRTLPPSPMGLPRRSCRPFPVMHPRLWDLSWPRRWRGDGPPIVANFGAARRSSRKRRCMSFGSRRVACSPSSFC